ncbi:hypothetical protein KZI27_01360 [Curtobacterium sp. TC1]|uniref:hypothetical protein n=1 Tax=Curtobacterium sp. TC1 TaxID=2862880 RepID=UPI001C9A52B1|nr:hypothetical protein [Curtobacterium sp. TC1]QZQ55545.1 hypothetical protein KZI27_01360 [Curtobacterium sp. TC1]
MTPQDSPKLRSEQGSFGAHWNRFVAWCAATSQASLPAAPATIEQFLAAFPGAASTQRLRRSSIRAHHLAAGYPDPLPALQGRVWPHQSAPHSVDVGEVLAAIPKYRYPLGLRGRRDAFLIVLLGVLHLTRREAQTVTAGEVAVTSIVRIRGKVVPSADDPAACAACAVTRWLRIVGPVWTGFRGDVVRLLDPTRGNLDVHDCEQPVPGEWRRAEQLLLPLDVHGWAQTGVTLSGRSITGIVPVRRVAAAHGTEREAVGPVVRAGSRFDELTLPETYAALGAADSAADHVLARITALWQDARALDAALEPFASTSKHGIAPDSDR